MGFRKRAAKHREILAEDKDRAAMDTAIADDHTITRNDIVLHPEIMATVFLEHVPFFETAVIEKQVDPFTRSQLAFCVLGINAFLATAHAGALTAVFQLFNDSGHYPSPG